MTEINEQLPLVVKIETFERDAPGKRWQLVNQEAKRVDYQFRDNVRESKAFFESLGGLEEGNSKGGLVSTSPDRLTKVERYFQSAHLWTDDMIAEYNSVQSFDTALNGAEATAKAENGQANMSISKDQQESR